MRNMDRQAGKIEMGMNFFIVAVLGLVALPSFWVKLPVWGRVLSIIGIGVCVLLGVIFRNKPNWPSPPEK